MIDWSKVQTNVISTVLIGIVAGALAIVWKGATSVDDKVNASAEALRIVVEELQKEIVDLKEHNNELTQAINDLRKEIEKEPGKKKIEINPVKLRSIPDEHFLEQKMEPAFRPWEQRNR